MLVLLGFILMSAFSYAQASAEHHPYFNTAEVYKITFPEKWKIEPHGGQTVAALDKLHDKEDPFHENINIVAEEFYEGEMSLKDYYKYVLKEMHDYIQDIDVLDKGKTNINGVPMRWISYSFFSNIAEVQLTDRVYLAVHNHKAYIITCSAESTKYASYLSAFESAVNTFSFDTIGYGAYKSDLNTQTIYEPNVSQYEVSSKHAREIIREIPQVKEKIDLLAELRHDQIYLKTLIISEPTEDNPVYIVETGENNPFNYRQMWQFQVDAHTGFVKYFSPRLGKYISLDQWK